MSQSTPSLTALLGLLAVAGFQNRDKIAEMLGGLGGHAAQPAGGAPSPASVPPAAGGGLLGGLSGVLGNLTGRHDADTFLGGGLNELADRFRQNGQGAVADSWIGKGPNQPIGPQDMEKVVGSDTLDSLTKQTGLTREELLARLSRELPQAVDNYTPDGRLPGRA